MKKILKLPLVVFTFLMATTAPTLDTQAATGSFPDINGSFAKNDIQALYDRGIVNGYNDGDFHPNAPVTRAEFADMLLKAKGFPVPSTYSSLFRDVQRGEWYTSYVELSYRLGITSGTEDGNWHPYGNLTREEMIQMAVNALGPESETARHQSYDTYMGMLSSYQDVGQIQSWGVKAISYAVQKGLIHGTPEGDLQPQKTATRAEVAAFLNHILNTFSQGSNHMSMSTGNLPYVSSIGALATAYTYNDSGSTTFTGLQVRSGMVAVDPTVIPLGAHLYIPGYGYGVAGDEGGAIKQKRVDLYMNSDYVANQFGMQNVNVYVLD